MTREEVTVEFSGLTHNHQINSMVRQQQYKELNFIQQLNGDLLDNAKATTMVDNQENADNRCDSLSTIAILRRHPMYDSLVLIKRYRACLNGYTLEFPTSDIKSSETDGAPSTSPPIEQEEKQPQHASCSKNKLVSLYLDGDDPIYQSQEKMSKNKGLLSPEGEIVHVPMNGLLDRLDNYEKHGIAIDSRVYAFAMGLKTAEKFLTTSSIKELQETPPL